MDIKSNEFPNKIIYKELSYKIIGLAMEAHRELGGGFLEKVYENALMLLLNKNNIKAVSQFPLKVNFRGSVVGEFFADILIEDKIIIELKTCEQLNGIHRAQVVNYLKATGMKLGFLINFGKSKFEYERFINGTD